jgi:tetratricopeptide (TPR) repeat protein
MGAVKFMRSDEPETTFRYDAFISYRHADVDRRWAKWLHAALEGYRVAKRLRREKGLPPRLTRVFRDEEELAASPDLNAEIETALGQSKFLIVICSPRTPASEWVNREVERFREMGRHQRILSLLIEGEPGESFPRALVEIRSGDADEPHAAIEPLAADVRGGGRARKRLALLRLVATILGVAFDDLRRRDRERRRALRRRAAVAAAVLLVGFAGLGVALSRAWQRAERATRLDQLEQRLNGAFSQADMTGAWADGQPRAVTSLLGDIDSVDAGRATSARAKSYQHHAEWVRRALQAPQLDEQDVGRIERSIAALETLRPALVGPLRDALRTRLASWEKVFAADVPTEPAAAAALFEGPEPQGGERALVFDAPGGDVASRATAAGGMRWEVEFDGWPSGAQRLGIAIVPPSKDGIGYRLMLGADQLQLLRGGDIVTRQAVPASAREHPPRISLRREGETVTFGLVTAAGGAGGSEFLDLFPPANAQPCRYVLCGTGSRIAVRHLLAERQLAPANPSALERGDALWNAGRYEPALTEYRAQIATTEGGEGRQAATFKSALCLLALGRPAEAEHALQAVIGGGSGGNSGSAAGAADSRWPTLAASRLWAMLVEQRRYDDADTALETVRTREDCATMSIQDLIRVDRREFQASLLGYIDAATDDLVAGTGERAVTRLEGLVTVWPGRPFEEPLERARLMLAEAYAGRGRTARAVDLLKPVVEAGPPERPYFRVYCSTLAQLLRKSGSTKEAERYLDRWINDGRGGERMFPGASQLLVERARVHAELKQWDAAERDLASFFRRTDHSDTDATEPHPATSTTRPTGDAAAATVANSDADRRSDPLAASGQSYFYAAHLLHGFLLQDRGNGEGAERAWREGVSMIGPSVSPSGRPREPLHFPMGLRSLLGAAIAGGLTGEWTDAESRAMLDQVVLSIGNDKALGVMARALPPSFLAASRTAWRSDRGRAFARNYAFGTETATELRRQFATLTCWEALARGSMDRPLSKEEDDVYWRLANDGYDAVIGGRLSGGQLGQLALAWKGHLGFLGWGGVSKSLPKNLRGPLALILARRQQKQGKPGDAAPLFRTARDDAEPGSALRRIAESALANAESTARGAPSR